MARLQKQFAKPFETFNTVELSQSALLGNFDIFQQLEPAHRVIPVLKANAYGHGLTEIAQILKAREFPYIAVDGYFEALELRAVSKQPVLVMGAIHPDNYSRMHLGRDAFMVQDEVSIKALGGLGKNVKLHLEIDTGMHRQGIQAKRLIHFINLIDSFPSLELEGIMSHLADADGEDRSYTEKQVDLLDKTIQLVHTLGHSPRYVHLAQSAGSVTINSKYANTYRVGLGLYGINPFTPEDTRHHELKVLRPVLSLKSTIIKINHLKKGDKVSYNGIFTAPRDMKIGVLPLGYYEGLPRALSNKGLVVWRDKYLRIVGRICMNHTLVSLEGTTAKVGDEVTVISSNPGNKNSLGKICDQFGLFNYETLVHIAPTIRRIIAH